MAIKNLLFIPAYNCRPQISRVLEKLIPYSGFFDEILVIDNRSSDGTAETARAYIRGKPEFQNARVVRNPVNLNLGGTHKMAFLYAIENHFNHVMILHGDDQGDISDFRNVLEMSRKTEFEEFILGARFSPDSKLKNYSVIRIWGNRGFNLLASALNGKLIPDLGGSGMNLFPVKLIKEHPFLQYADDLTFHVFLLLGAMKLKQKISFRPISWSEDDQISNVRMIRQARKLFRVLVQNAFNEGKPLTDETSSFNSHPGKWELVLD